MGRLQAIRVKRDRGLRYGGWLGYGLAIGLVLFLALSPIAKGQIPAVSPTPALSAKPVQPSTLLSISTATPSQIATEAISLDGRELFSIAAPTVREQPNLTSGTLPLQERVRAIEATLNSLAKSPIDPATLKVTSVVESKSGLPIISVNDRYLMTVTTLDAQIQGHDPIRRADELTQTLKEALVQARRERDPNAVLRQAWIASQLLFGMFLTSWLVSRLQGRLQRSRQRPETIAADRSTAIAEVQEQLSQRQQRNLRDVRRRLLQLLQGGIWVGGCCIILGLFPYTRWLQTLVLSRPLKILGIALATYAAVRFSNVLIDRVFSILAVEELVSPDRAQRLALRVKTFSRVLRSGVSIICVSVGFLSVLSAIGVDLAPVLAGAGILGLAVSFASQNLIKDMINGMLILYEDQYAVGDVIQVGKAAGLVEYMNLRITQLRNGEGRLITIPNSSIAIVENLSKDWSRVDLPLTIAHDADLEAALILIRQVSQDLSQDTTWESKILEPPEVLGVDELSSAGVMIRIWIKTLPLQQWNVGREFRRRLKLALDEQGIAIGSPQSFLLLNPPATEKLLADDLSDDLSDSPDSSHPKATA